MTIYDIVEDLKERYGTTDPFELCEYLGIKVSISPLGSLKGLYTYIDGVPVILISSAIKRIPQLIVCAHELGHHVLHSDIAIETKKGPILCETYRFTSLGAFLYFELFKCIEEKFMPVKCRNCGRWFIMKHTTFSHYCKRLVSSNPPKTCRDNAMSHNFKEKIKSDPVWEIYNRAYKQHYARYMKKKMSKSQFAEWGDYAIELRTKAADGELEMEEYQRLIRI